MSKSKDGGPAFPAMIISHYVSGTDGQGASTAQPVYSHDSGMSLRDWFAGQALSCIPLRAWEGVGSTNQDIINAWATCAYATADAMLAARTLSEGE